MTSSSDSQPDPTGGPGETPGADEVLEPDEVTAGPASNEMRGAIDDSFGLDDLSERAVGIVIGLLSRAALLGRAVLIFAVLSCAFGFFLGVAALDGAARVGWIIVGGFFSIWAIGSTALALWRLRRVRKSGGALVEEVRTLIRGDVQSERTVIQTVESTEGADDDGVVYMSRQFFSLKDAVQDHTSNFASLGFALSSITTFPGLMALATLISFAMLCIGSIFGLILLF